MPVGTKQLRFGPFQLDAQCGQLRKNGFGVKLQGQPVQILEILLEKPGELVTREELRQRLWSPDTFVEFEHSLNAAVQRLRQALGDDAETPQYIETIPKRGYRFVGQVEREEPIKIVGSLAPKEPHSPEVKRKLVGRFRVMVFASAALFLAVAPITYLLTRRLPQPRIVASRALTKTGFPKSGGLTDGHNIYFLEAKPDRPVIMHVSIKGGDAAPLDTSPIRSLTFLSDISFDGSALLMAVQQPGTERFDAWVQPLPAGSPRLLAKDVMQARWTPDGKGLLFGRRESGGIFLYRANADGSGVQRLTQVPGVVGLAISPDGKRIRFGVGHTVWEATADGFNARPILTENGGWAGTWSTDGKYFFYKSWDSSNLWAVSDPPWWSLRKKLKPVQMTFGPFWFGAPTISKDGKHIYAIATERHGELSIYDSKSRQFVPYLGGIPACYVDFSIDGQWITYVSYPEGDLWRSRIDGTERRQLTGPPYAVVNPRWSPDGKFIVFDDLSGGDRRHVGESARMYVVSADGGEPLLLPGDSSGNQYEDPNWSPDGRKIVYAVVSYIYGPLGARPLQIRILDLQAHTSSQVVGPEGLWSPRWSPDGKYLVALLGMPPYKLMLFTFSTQQWSELATGTYFGWPSWTRDSKRVVVRDYRQIVGIDVSTGKKTQIADISTFRATAYYMWIDEGFGITPDGTPISTRDTSVDEIHVFDLEYK